MTEVRYEVSMAAAKAIIELVSAPGCRLHPKYLGTIAFFVQEAIYESEARMAEAQPRWVLCLGCFHTLRYQPEHAGRRIKCPYCEKKMRLPDGRNAN